MMGHRKKLNSKIALKAIAAIMSEKLFFIMYNALAYWRGPRSDPNPIQPKVVCRARHVF